MIVLCENNECYTLRVCNLISFFLFLFGLIVVGWYYLEHFFLIVMFVKGKVN